MAYTSGHRLWPELPGGDRRPPDERVELPRHGATFLFPDVHTVIDIGGQDVKVLQIDNGVMTNFVMNDKCSAGTGRFLDVMARVLEVKVEDLGTLGSPVHQVCGDQLHLHCVRRERGHQPAVHGDQQVATSSTVSTTPWPTGWPVWRTGWAYGTRWS